MRVYLAGSLRARDTIAELACELYAREIEVVSTWHDSPKSDNVTAEVMAADLRRDIEDMAQADVLVAITHLPEPSAPKATWGEVGWFLRGRGIALLVYGNDQRTVGLWGHHERAFPVQWSPNMGLREFAEAISLFLKVELKGA